MNDVHQEADGASVRAVLGRLFVLDLSGGRIFTLNPDGSDPKTIVTGSRHPDGIVVDADAGHIYWTNMGVPNRKDGSMALGIFDKSYAKATAGSSDEHANVAPDLFTAETPLGTYQGITDQTVLSRTPGSWTGALCRIHIDWTWLADRKVRGVLAEQGLSPNSPHHVVRRDLSRGPIYLFVATGSSNP
jgi:hypothetical protein